MKPATRRNALMFLSTVGLGAALASSPKAEPTRTYEEQFQYHLDELTRLYREKHGRVADDAVIKAWVDWDDCSEGARR